MEVCFMTLDQAKEHFPDATSFKKGISWKGYNVLIPEYEETVIVGPPFVILLKGEDARISTYDESILYLNYELTKK